MEDPPDCRKQETTTTTTITAATGSVQNHHTPEPDQPPRRPHLCIDIPATSGTPADHASAEADDITPTPDTTKRRPGPAGVPTTPSARGWSTTASTTIPPRPPPPQRSPSFMLRQTVRSLLPVGSFKSSVTKGYEKASLSKLFGGGSSRRMVRTSSLPLVDDDGSAGGVVDADLSQQQQKKAAHICRSQSLPMTMKKLNNGGGKSFKRMDSMGGMFRVVPSSTTPRGVPEDITTVPTTTEPCGGGGEDIPEEEAVCRICMVELSEGSDTTLKLECACRGELALAHRDCALKWFTIKGSRSCEVCRREVRNLPVTLMRVQSMPMQGGGDHQARRSGAGNDNRSARYVVWHGTPILVIVSILAYFCFLEELLVVRNGIAALAISLPFSCILGLFSSLTTTSMVARRFVWIYAAVQFLFVVFFTHLFYGFLHLQAVISIILATFAGFGVGMTGNSIVAEILRWRVRRVAAPPADTRRRSNRTRAAQRQAPTARAASDQTSGQQQQQPPPPAAASDSNEGESNAGGAGDIENPQP